LAVTSCGELNRAELNRADPNRRDREQMADKRTAIVTGAGRGIGAAIALRLANDGNRVAVIDLREEDTAHTVNAIIKAGGEALGVGADVSNEDAVTAAVARIAAELGEPTILVNNAGILRDNLLFKMTTSDWDAVMNVHLRGTFLMSRAVQAFQVKNAWGRIVSISSTSALGNRGQSNYSAAKAGIQGITKTMAIELGRYNVTANSIAPGMIATDMLRETAERVGMPFEDFMKAAAADIPVGRWGEPEDIAAAASFFVSDEASFVSGQVLYVAGGPKN
jgi:3-oxoacyl-[acyl-carrier protein] reductase